MLTPTSIFQLTDQEIFVITTRYAGQQAGQVATWVMPASLIPDHLRLVIALSPWNATMGLIEQSQGFAIQLLASHQAELMVRFGLYSSRDFDKFTGLDLEDSPAGYPLLPDTCGWADCQVRQCLRLGDRNLLVVDVANQVLYPHRQPLREQAAFAQLQPADREALSQKYQRDIAKSRQHRVS
jgi:flavin reductase (DIM6/NTAB) family NADH-FMN oxidoreductase RutF